MTTPLSGQCSSSMHRRSRKWRELRLILPCHSTVRLIRIMVIRKKLRGTHLNNLPPNVYDTHMSREYLLRRWNWRTGSNDRSARRRHSSRGEKLDDKKCRAATPLFTFTPFPATWTVSPSFLANVLGISPTTSAFAWSKNTKALSTPDRPNAFWRSWLRWLGRMWKMSESS